MSASLVGSEMCIRDSPSRAVDVDVEALSAPAQFKFRMLFAISYVGGQRPVSYTHLTLPTICSV
eukprot:2633485-Alexandrium_andersonii.AAC.1